VRSENDPRRCEREFDIRNVRLPRRDVSNVFDGYRLPVDVAENGLEENADTDGELVEFTETLLFEDCEVGHLVGCAVELEFADCVEWRRFVHTLSYGDVALELSPHGRGDGVEGHFVGWGEMSVYTIRLVN